MARRPAAESAAQDIPDIQDVSSIWLETNHRMIEDWLNWQGSLWQQWIDIQSEMWRQWQATLSQMTAWPESLRGAEQLA